MSKQRGTPVGRAVGWGVLVGGSVGFALGLLLAPEKGENVRRRLSYRLNALAEQAQVLAQKWASQGGDGPPRKEGDAIVAKAEEDAAAIHSRMDEIISDAGIAGASDSADLDA